MNHTRLSPLEYFGQSCLAMSCVYRFLDGIGSELTLIDFVAAPWALRFWMFDQFKHGTGIPAKGKSGADEEV